MTSRSIESAQRAASETAGMLYIATMATAVFAQMFVRMRLVVDEGVARGIMTMGRPVGVAGAVLRTRRTATRSPAGDTGVTCCRDQIAVF